MSGRYCAFCGAGEREASECEDVRCRMVIGPDPAGDDLLGVPRFLMSCAPEPFEADRAAIIADGEPAPPHQAGPGMVDPKQGGPLIDLAATGRASVLHRQHRALRGEVLDLVAQLALGSGELAREHAYATKAEELLAFVSGGADPELRLDCLRRAFGTFPFGRIRLSTAFDRARLFEAFMAGKPLEVFK